MPLAPRDRGCGGFGACGICRLLLGYLPGGSAWVCTCLLSVLPARLRETRAALFARCPQTFGHQCPGSEVAPTAICVCVQQSLEGVAQHKTKRQSSRKLRCSLGPTCSPNGRSLNHNRVHVHIYCVSECYL